MKTTIINPASDISLHKKYTASFRKIRSKKHIQSRKKSELIYKNMVQFGYDLVAKHEELKNFGPGLKAGTIKLRQTKE